MDTVFGDASDDVGQVGLRVDAVHLCCFDDGVDAGGALASGVGPTKKMALIVKSVATWDAPATR